MNELERIKDKWHAHAPSPGGLTRDEEAKVWAAIVGARTALSRIRDRTSDSWAQQVARDARSALE